MKRDDMTSNDGGGDDVGGDDVASHGSDREEIETLLDFRAEEATDAGAATDAGKATDAEEATDAVIVNDGVMGGRSSSRFDRAPSGGAVFEGTLSLENGGGFASVRLPIPAGGMADAAGLVLRVRGDGRRYEARLRPERGFGEISWTASFDTVTDEWITADLPIEDFEPTFRGRRPRRVEPLDPADVVQVGIMLKDGEAGPFRLEIERIVVRRGPDPATDTTGTGD